MASKALVTTDRVDWREAFQHSLKRALQMVGALVLLAAMLFLALALVSYTQTDPSPSTAAAPDGPIGNWMGRPGAWAAERALFLFGWTSVLVLPLLYQAAGGDDKTAFQIAPDNQFTDQETCHDGFARAGIVCQNKS